MKQIRKQKKKKKEPKKRRPRGNLSAQASFWPTAHLGES
jgi:hypothetical protein